MATCSVLFFFSGHCQVHLRPVQVLQQTPLMKPRGNDYSPSAEYVESRVRLTNEWLHMSCPIQRARCFFFFWTDILTTNWNPRESKALKPLESSMDVPKQIIPNY